MPAFQNGIHVWPVHGLLFPDSLLIGQPDGIVGKSHLHPVVDVPLKGKYKENTIFYSGTHDNQTIMSFYNEQNEQYKKLVDSICKIKFTDRPNLKIIECCMKQKSDYCIIPMQDYLGLTDDIARMNEPSTIGHNWCFRTLNMDYSSELKDYILKITAKYKRIN